MEILNALGVNWQLLLAQAVNFGIVLAALTFFVYKPLLKVIDDRREATRLAAEGVERAQKQAQEFEEQRQSMLRAADQEAGKIIEAAKQQAEKVQKDLIADAQRQADQIIERGRKLIDDERMQALAEVRDTVAKVVVQLTETLLRREFSDADQKRMLSELSEKIPTLLK